MIYSFRAAVAQARRQGEVDNGKPRAQWLHIWTFFGENLTLRGGEAAGPF